MRDILLIFSTFQCEVEVENDFKEMMSTYLRLLVIDLDTALVQWGKSRELSFG
jgi:hypothetical protein